MPSSAQARAIPRPIPDPAPVTSATLPLRSSIGHLLLTQDCTEASVTLSAMTTESTRKAEAATSAWALRGMTVLEDGGGIAASYAGKLLADLGAEVIKVEPPGGDRVRRQSPFKADPAGS